MYVLLLIHEFMYVYACFLFVLMYSMNPNFKSLSTFLKGINAPHTLECCTSKISYQVPRGFFPLSGLTKGLMNFVIPELAKTTSYIDIKAVTSS